MELKQQLKLSQQLVMTPQLQQAIKLLQISRAELVDLVRQEMLENPVLEDTAEGPDDSGGDGPVSDAPDLGEYAPTKAAALEDITQHEGVVDKERPNEIDWERYLENHAMQAPMPVYRGSVFDGEDQGGLESSVLQTEGLTAHLEWQVRMNDFTEIEQKFAELVIGNLNDDGYLSLEGVSKEEIVPTLAKEAELDSEDAEEVLKIMQRFDPMGVASRDLQECLRVQAEHFKLDPLVLYVIDNHLTHLEKKNFQAIANDTQASIEEVLDVAQAISDLEPRPARNYASEEPQYITPDVYVHKVGDQYFVVANDDGLPKLKISGFYRAALQGDEKAKEYVRSKLRSAQWLIRSIDQRRKTIVRVTESIVARQIDFFEKGIEHLRPMTLKDIADEVGLHESTVSRVTSNKYVHTARGLFELKYFFNSAIKRDHQDDIASESVKQAIKKIVTSEDPRNPLSDQQIVEILSQGNVVIARRTVAKYREILGILSSSRRKKYF